MLAVGIVADRRRKYALQGEDRPGAIRITKRGSVLDAEGALQGEDRPEAIRINLLTPTNSSSWNY